MIDCSDSAKPRFLLRSPALLGAGLLGLLCFSAPGRAAGNRLRILLAGAAAEVFVAQLWKNFSVTVAYADLGKSAMMTGQRGWYLSLQGSL